MSVFNRPAPERAGPGIRVPASGTPPRTPCVFSPISRVKSTRGTRRSAAGFRSTSRTRTTRPLPKESTSSRSRIRWRPLRRPLSIRSIPRTLRVRVIRMYRWMVERTTPLRVTRPQWIRLRNRVLRIRGLTSPIRTRLVLRPRPRWGWDSSSWVC